MKARDVYNVLMKVLLRSPLHGVVSGTFMLITFTGRKSGSVYTTPVEYFSVDGAMCGFSATERTWWKNLRGGAPVTLRLRGRTVPAQAQAFTDDDFTRQTIRGYLAQHPRRAKLFGITPAPDGTLPDAEIEQAAKRLVALRYTPE